ncbi:diacylglycerol kinase family protein [Pararhodobacter sp. SW119]|uniref:diacylglycerol/lipid kinase family protein n=1 Tax=Pararhodobacter sp. SW119 TaxID=2780075 RepID=UPI001ADF320E|nr:diacylglycerol kinase family protein [Pararhodobacter sp. SW119]
MAKPEGRPGPDFAVILNTDSGDGDQGASPGEIERLFTDRDCEVRIFSLRAGGNIADAVSKAIASGAKCVVAAGGDGTICGVAGALVGTGVELGVIPLGTFNYFARGCGIPQEVDEAVDAVCCGTSRPINLGSINGEVFLNNASLGLYAAILARREGIYRKWGRSRLAAYWSVLATMATVHRPLTMRITIDGEVRRDKSPMIFVAVSAYQLDEFGIEGADAIRSGEFAVLLAPNCGRFRLIWKALLIALHGVQEGRDFKLLTGKNVVVETRRSRALVARDGERERMTAPFTFRLLEDAIQLRVPDPEKPTDAAP